MVNLTNVPAYKPTTAGLTAASMSGGLSRRAAGYPISAADSHPSVQRDFNNPDDSSAALEGPLALPKLPDIGAGRHHHHRRLQQQQASDGVVSASSPLSAVGNACTRGASCFSPRFGFPGLDAPATGSMGLAVGKKHIVQAAGGVMTVHNVGATGMRSTTVRSVSLQSFFAGVAPNCDGVHDAAVVYDKRADRFVVAAACGGYGRVLLAVSATPSAAGTWFLYGLVADAVGTKLECLSPKEQALADYPQLGYNADGLFVTYYSYCPSKPSVAGAVLLALPKYKAYQGAPSMFYAVYTSAEIAAAAGLTGGAAAVTQLQPVVPQAAGDVAEGLFYFVADAPRASSKRSGFTLVALANTGALWGYAAELNGVPSPSLVATAAAWGQAAPIYPEARLKQPGGGADLSAGGVSPAGFWTGGVSYVWWSGWGLQLAWLIQLNRYQIKITQTSTTTNTHPGGPVTWPSHADGPCGCCRGWQRVQPPPRRCVG